MNVCIMMLICTIFMLIGAYINHKEEDSLSVSIYSFVAGYCFAICTHYYFLI